MASAELEPRLQRQPEAEQGAFKLSYTLAEPDPRVLPAVRQTLRTPGLLARPHLFQHRYLDVLPLSASKVEALGGGPALRRPHLEPGAAGGTQTPPFPEPLMPEPLSSPPAG